MLTTILRTKLFTSQVRSVRVTQPRLLEALDQGLERKMTIVAAPAGYGRSSLLSGWLSQRELPAGWLSLDRGDIDSVRLFSHVIEALSSIDSQFGVEIREALHSSPPPSHESVLSWMINDLEILPTPLILVLDDFHSIGDQTVHPHLGDERPSLPQSRRLH